VPEYRTAYLASCGETESRISVIECRLDASAVEEVSCEVLAAGGAHFVCFEERAAYPVLRMFTEAVPCIGVWFCRSVKQFF